MYTDFDEKIENEIIKLSHLTKNKDKTKKFYYLIDDEEEEDNKKRPEQLDSESLKLYYRIDQEKNKELESTFKTP